MTVDTIEKLWAIEEIKRLKARYFRDLDTKDWDDLATVFDSDAVFDIRAVNSIRHPLTQAWQPPLAGNDQVFSGGDVIVAMIRSAIDKLYTVHHAHVPEIEILSETSATGVWPMEDKLRHASGELLLTGSGHYRETYTKGADGWRIKTSTLSRLWLHGGALSVESTTMDDAPS